MADGEEGRVDAATLPAFSNQRGCPQCGARYEIRVHFDRDCSLVRGDHFHRVCRCGHEWLERCTSVRSARPDLGARADRAASPMLTRG